MTTTLRILVLSLLFIPIQLFADCASHYQELSQKILAHHTKGLISSAEDMKQFLLSTEALSSKDRLLFLKRLMELAKKDFELASDYSRALNQLTVSGVLTKSNLEDIIAINNESKIVFHLDSELRISYSINLPPEALSNAALIPQYQWQIINLNLPLENQQKLVQAIQEMPSGDLTSALNFMSGLNESERISFANEFKTILVFNSPSPLFKKYQKNIKKFNQFESRTFKETQKELKKLESKLTEEELLARAKKTAKDQRRIYENLSYGCKGSGQESVAQQVAAKKFTRFRSVMGMSTNISMYAFNNWDLEKNSDWFSKLGYELSMGQAMNYVNSKIVTNNKDSYYKKALKNYGVFSIADFGSSMLYGKLYDTSQKTMEEKLEALQKDPAFREEVKKLHQILEDAKAEETVMSKMDYVFTDKDFDPEKITPKDLESPEIKELFLELMAKEIYYQNSGDMIQTGSTGMDRFAFSRLYGVVASTKGMAINLIIYNILCMGGLNPALAYLKAGSIFMVDHLITSYYYYKLRREMINQ